MATQANGPAAPTPETEQKDAGPGRRAYTRHAVDCAVLISPLSGAGKVSGKLKDLSLGGCRVEPESRFQAGILTRVEVLFQLQGLSFRILGVTVGNRAVKTFAIRFVDMSTRLRESLTELIAEVAAVNAINAANATKTIAAAIAPEEGNPPAAGAYAILPPLAILPRKETPPQGQPPTATADEKSLPAMAPAPLAPRNRRSHNRHPVDTTVKLLLVRSGISMQGRILNLSQGGCRLRTEERFNVGIYVRVVAEFSVHGLPFQLAGVSQAIMDKNTIGIRFLDMSERRREQLSELIVEIAEAQAATAENLR